MAIIATKVKTRDEKMLDAINAPIELDVNIDMRMARANDLSNDPKKKYMCTCCGKKFTTQKNNFSKSASPLYQANDGYLNICNSCRDNYYYRLVDLYNGNQAHAIRHFCQQFDIIFHEDALTASRQISSDRSRISHYQAKKNLGQTARVGSTYIDGMKYDYQNKLDDVIESREQAKSEDSTITASAVDRWGVGFTELDYKLMDDHYKMLKRQNPNCDANQEIFIKSLCSLSMLQTKALKSGDSKEYTSLVEQYAKTFKQAGLKTIQETDKNADDCWGIFMEQISQYTPEEYYKDKKLYEDFDGIGKMFERFVLRPLKNLMCKTNERDPEFNVEDAVDE